MNKKEEELVTVLHRAIVTTTLETLSHQDVIDKEIAFMLFDYHFDFPFEPAVGLCQTTERDYFKEHHGILSAYGTADMEYFSENDNPKFDFDAYEGFAKSAQALTDLLDDYEYEDKKQFIIDFYIGVCQELMRHKELSKVIKMTEDFHIVANDYSEINVKVYLDVLLPKDALEALNKQIAQEEDEMRLTEADDRRLTELSQMMKVAQDRYDALKRDVQQLDTETLYSKEQVYFLQPFEYEIKNQKLKWKSFDDVSVFKKEPMKSNNYYMHKVYDGKIVYSAAIIHDEIASECFYLYEYNNEIDEAFRISDADEHKYEDRYINYFFQINDGAPYIDEINYLYLRQSRPYRFEECSYDTSNTSSFIYGENKLLQSSRTKEYQVMDFAGYKVENAFMRYYEFDQNNEVTSIRRETSTENYVEYPSA